MCVVVSATPVVIWDKCIDKTVPYISTWPIRTVLFYEMARERIDETVGTLTYGFRYTFDMK